MFARTFVTMALGMVLALGCSSAGSGNGAGTGSGAGSSGNGSQQSAGALSQAEIDGVIFTREEEKLARDVYAALVAHDSMFTNIGASEQTHMDAIATLLDRYTLADPAAGKAQGQFTNATLQKLHDALVAQGGASYAAALAVGAEIEELDIHDIEAARLSVSHTDILTTYDNLTRGSRNHLRAFYGKLQGVGVTYTPKHLDAAAFQTIVTSPMEKGP